MADLEDGQALPPYASDANKQLDAEVKRKEGDLENVEEKLDSDGKRVKVMTDHLVNVQQELVNTQQLVDVKKNEAESEGHLVTRNQKYKENFQMANQQNQTELEEKQMLEEQSRAANEVLFKKKKVLSQLEREEQEDVKRYEEVQGNLEKLDAHVNELSAARDVLRQDIDGQAPKLERATQALEVSRRRALEAGVDLGVEAPPTLDIEARSLKDQNQSVLFSLSNALQEHAEDVLPLFESLCNEKGIARPSRPPSVASSRPGSSQASMLGMGGPRMGGP